MGCKEFQEQISPAVDNYLSEEEKVIFADHIARCPECRYEYEIESITKSVVKGKLKSVPASEALLQRVAVRLAEETVAATVSWSGWWERIRNATVFRPAIAFALACGAIILLLNVNPEADPDSVSTLSSVTPADVIEQSLANFEAVTSGYIRPQLASDQPEQMRAFFQGKTEFDVMVPYLRDCMLVGGVVNEYSGVKLAHVLYNHDNNNVIYMYQVGWETVLKGDKLSLAPEAKEELLRTKWYKTNQPDGCAMILWTDGKTLCSAVARMDLELLMACLTLVEEADQGW